eukprot:5450279-Prorocentrum_lima.AAC.1
MQDYTRAGVKTNVMVSLCAPENSLDDPNTRPISDKQGPSSSSSRTFCVLEEYGLLDECYGRN